MIWPGGREGVLGLVEGEKDPLAFLLAQALMATWQLLPLRPSTPAPSPANYRLRSLARPPAAIPSSRISRAFWRSSGVVSPPRPLPRRPGFFCGISLRGSLRLQQCCRNGLRPTRLRLLDRQGFFSYGADPVLAV